jgi:ribosomal protein L40E
MFVGRVKRGVVVLLLGFGGMVAISFIVPFPFSPFIIIVIYIIIIRDLFKVMPKDVFCQKCGNANSQGSSFCAKCGSELKVNSMTCQKCPNTNIEGSTYCSKCGSAL